MRSTPFSSRWFLCAQKSPYALHPVSQKFPQLCLWNSSSVRLTDDGPLSSFQERSPSASSFHASLLQTTDGVVSVAFCPQVVSQAPQHLRSSETQATCEGCFARQGHFSPACPGQYTQRNFRRWMSFCRCCCCVTSTHRILSDCRIRRIILSQFVISAVISAFG